MTLSYSHIIGGEAAARGSDRGNEIAKSSGCAVGSESQRRPSKSSTTYYQKRRKVPRIHHTSLRINQANTVKMVVMYNIAGRQIASHWLSIATLSITFGGAALAMGGKKVEKTTTPPINAKNSDEEKFIKDFLADMDSSEKKAQKA
ncbi:hypothetical protein V496_00195 [Pseudogymnoascus sp. VKM F-4515 (FW-2607)]|nr:hypothetical protein V496_00195 [Pseudogymnoascus sp. VKM F-4515 (FW-2607)]KFY99597.1 hypothetical protein V498_00664 [Pseudogymnoascus sp. VKM F-4517 (FW-2822)]